MTDQLIPPNDPLPPPLSGGDGDSQEALRIEDELKDSYLSYAMSVIISRALPDVRDGLKPSQRRILVAMNDLHLGPNAGRVKCAKICGDTSGNYHPHGEASVAAANVSSDAVRSRVRMRFSASTSRAWTRRSYSAVGAGLLRPSSVAIDGLPGGAPRGGRLRCIIPVSTNDAPGTFR